MAAKRTRKKRPASNPVNCPDEPKLFRNLASALSSTQTSKLPIMKSLYCLLVHLSLSEPVSSFHSNGSSRKVNIKSGGNEVELNFEEIPYLADVLFTELDLRFNEFFSALRKENDEQSVFTYHTQAAVEEVTLLVRCCMNILTFLVSHQELAVEKGRALLLVLGRLVSMELTAATENSSFVFRKSVSCEYTHNDGHATSAAKDFVASIYFTEPSDPCRAFLCTVLEVFADELLMNKMVREHLLLIDSVFSSSKIFNMCGVGSEIGSVLEVIAAHFILSFSNEKAIQMFFDRLFWQLDNEFRTPEISLGTAISLLTNPVMFSAPKMFHAYLVLLVSDAIGISTSHSKGLALQLVDHYLAAFERSVILYTRHMCSLDKAGHHVSCEVSVAKPFSESSSVLDLKYLLLPSTWEKIDHLTTKINDSWGSYLSNRSTRENAEVVASSVSYLKESLHVFDNAMLEEILSEILSILSCIILRACSDDFTENDIILQSDKEMSKPDLCFLASTLKLMSCSMLQAILCLKTAGNSGSSKAIGDVSAWKEYDVIMNIVENFQKFGVYLPVQSFICNTMESHPQRHGKSKWMLLHFSGLLSFSFANKLDFLMKGSISAMLTVLYLFIFEESDLEALGPLVGPRTKSSSSVSSCGFGVSPALGKAGEAVADRKSCQAVALKFQKIRTLYLGTGSRTGSDQDDSDSAVDIQEDTCNGESFLKCVSERGTLKQSDIDDLADFIECKRGKDYSDWLKGRQMFRQRWKGEKLATYRWNKKKKAWRENKRKIT